MKDLLTTWTLDTLKDNPVLFGGDSGNPAIMLRYLVEVSDGGLVDDLTEGMISSAVTVSRMKNKLLEQHKELEYRDKNKPTERRLQKEQLPYNIRELMTPKEAKIVKYLDNHNAWDYTSSRIKKSVRGIDSIDIECVLRNKDKYQKETSFDDTEGVSSDTRRQINTQGATPE